MVSTVQTPIAGSANGSSVAVTLSSTSAANDLLIAAVIAAAPSGETIASTPAGATFTIDQDWVSLNGGLRLKLWRVAAGQAGAYTAITLTTGAATKPSIQVIEVSPGGLQLSGAVVTASNTAGGSLVTTYGSIPTGQNNIELFVIADVSGLGTGWTIPSSTPAVTVVGTQSGSANATTFAGADALNSLFTAAPTITTSDGHAVSQASLMAVYVMPPGYILPTVASIWGRKGAPQVQFRLRPYIPQIAPSQLAPSISYYTVRATLGTAGAIARAQARPLPATLATAGKLTPTTITRALAAIFSPTAALSRRTGRLVAGSISPTGTLQHRDLATAFVQTWRASTSSAVSSLSTGAPAASTIQGNALVCLISLDGQGNATPAAPSGVTDSAGNAWTHATGFPSWNANNFPGVDAWYCINASPIAASTGSVTVTMGGSTSKLGIHVAEYSGLGASATLNLHQGFSQTSTTLTSGPTTGSALSADLVLFLGTNTNVTTDTGPSAGTAGWNARYDSAAAYPGNAWGDILSATAGTITAAWTMDSSHSTQSLILSLTPGAPAYAHTLTAGFSPVAALSRLTTRTHIATLSWAAALSRLTGRPVAGTLSSSGTLQRTATRALTAAQALTAAIARATGRTHTGTLSSSGHLSRLTNRSQVSTLTTQGKLTPSAISRALTASLAPSAALARLTARTVPAATLSLSGAASGTLAWFQTLTGTLSLHGTSPARSMGRPLAATLTSSATLGRLATRTATATLSLLGLANRSASRQLPATLPTSATLSRQAQSHLAGTVSPSAHLTSAIQRAFAPVLSPSASLARAARRVFAPTLPVVGATRASVQRLLTAALPASGVLTRASQRAHAATLTLPASLRSTARATVAAHLTSTGHLGYAQALRLASSLRMTGATRTTLGRFFLATLSTHGSVTRRLTWALAGILRALGRLIPTRADPTVVAIIHLDRATASSVALDRATATSLTEDRVTAATVTKG